MMVRRSILAIVFTLVRSGPVLLTASEREQ